MGIPFVNAGHLNDGRIARSQLDYITREHFDILGEGKFAPGDILLCLRGSLGKFGVVASSLIIIRPKKNTLNLDFLVSYLRSKICDEMIERWAGGAAQPNLGGQDLACFLIPCPPLTEQRAIASVLSDLETELAALLAKRDKARAIKQGMMQKLLIGQVRLI